MFLMRACGRSLICSMHTSVLKRLLLSIYFVHVNKNKQHDMLLCFLSAAEKNHNLIIVFCMIALNVVVSDSMCFVS